MLGHDVGLEGGALVVDRNLYIASSVARVEGTEDRQDGLHHHLARREDWKRSPYLACGRSKVKDHIFGER